MPTRPRDAPAEDRLQFGRHEKFDGSHAQLFGQLRGGHALTPFELRISLRDGALDVLDFLRRKVRRQLLSESGEEEGLVLPAKLICHLQDILHSHGENM